MLAFHTKYRFSNYRFFTSQKLHEEVVFGQSFYQFMIRFFHFLSRLVDHDCLCLRNCDLTLFVTFLSVFSKIDFICWSIPNDIFRISLSRCYCSGGWPHRLIDVSRYLKPLVHWVIKYMCCCVHAHMVIGGVNPSQSLKSFGDMAIVSLNSSKVSIYSIIQDSTSFCQVKLFVFLFWSNSTFYALVRLRKWVDIHYHHIHRSMSVQTPGTSNLYGYRPKSPAYGCFWDEIKNINTFQESINNKNCSLFRMRPES